MIFDNLVLAYCLDHPVRERTDKMRARTGCEIVAHADGIRSQRRISQLRTALRLLRTLHFGIVSSRCQYFNDEVL